MITLFALSSFIFITKSNLYFIITWNVKVKYQNLLFSNTDNYEGNKSVIAYIKKVWKDCFTYFAIKHFTLNADVISQREWCKGHKRLKN
jgi:hypothetical protein